MDYKEALRYILSFTNYEKSLKALYHPGNVDLRRVGKLLDRLGNPHVGQGIVHVAGTKGKGSTAAMIASALTASGYRTGLYISPHLHTFRERIQIDGQPICGEDFGGLAEEIRTHVEEINRGGEHGQLTTFEVLTAMALLYYRRNEVDIEVLEVGVGGRLDATNVVQPCVCAITNISYDHMELLGDTLTKIALEKAGIIKPGVAVVTAPQAPEAETIFREVAAEKAAPRIRVGADITWEVEQSDRHGHQCRVFGRLEEYPLFVPLAGDYQLENASIAIGVLEELYRQGWEITLGGIQAGFEKLKWPGRLEVLSESPLLVTDGAHNGYSAGKLRESLVKYFEAQNVTFLVGVSSDKKVEDIAKELVPIAGRVIITRSRHPRAASVEKVASVFRSVADSGALGADIIVETAGSVEEALARAYEETVPQGTICATGSIFIVGEVIESVNKVPAELYG